MGENKGKTKSIQCYLLLSYEIYNILNIVIYINILKQLLEVHGDAFDQWSDRSDSCPLLVNTVLQAVLDHREFQITLSTKYFYFVHQFQKWILPSIIIYSIQNAIFERQEQ